MTNVHILAIDLAKRSFQICATSPGGTALLNRTVSRAKPEAHLREQAPCIVAMEACATSHFWGRFAQALGHDVRLISPIYVKPFVRRQKNDAADASAIAEAAFITAKPALCGGEKRRAPSSRCRVPDPSETDLRTRAARLPTERWLATFRRAR